MDTTQIIEFLKELQANNNKEWMDANRNRYKEAKENFFNLVSCILDQLKMFDESLEAVTPKECIFQINRDVRFSNDKSPYKKNFGAAIAEGGRHSLNAGYYIHIQPYNESFIGGGLYMPPGEVLKLVRQEIDYNAGELKEIVEDKAFKDFFGPIQGEKLKTAPKGYPKDHPNIELLRMKSHLVLHSFTDEEIKAPDFADNVVNGFKIMHPFNNYLNVAIS